jgi:hypothetical protein
MQDLHALHESGLDGIGFGAAPTQWHRFSPPIAVRLLDSCAGDVRFGGKGSRRVRLY